MFYLGCGDGQKDEKTTESNNIVTNIDTDNKAYKKNKAREVLHLVPSPIEIIMLVQKAGASYNPDILNKPENSSKYDTKFKKALNLGIYGADLSYASMFDQTQESMFFVSAAKKLAEGLGIMNAFDQSTIERVEANMGDRDSMLYMISEIYWTADAYLKETENINTSALIIAGGWIEGLHIAASLTGTNEDSGAIRRLVGEQKYALTNLIELVAALEETEMTISVKNDLESLKLLYDELNVKVSKPEMKGNKVGNIAVIEMSDEQLVAIKSKLFDIRTKYIS